MFEKFFKKLSHHLYIFREKLFGKMYCEHGYHNMEPIDPEDKSKGFHCVRPECKFEVKPTICAWPQPKDERNEQAEK